jgi:hypothetical protein
MRERKVAIADVVQRARRFGSPRPALFGHDRGMRRRANFWPGLLAAALFSLAGVGARAANQGDQPWNVIEDDEGIRVYEREIPGQELPGFRAETVMNAPIESIGFELQNYKHHTEWMDSCIASFLVKHLGNQHVIDYNRTHAPWPVWDRDVVLDSRWTISVDKRLLVVTFENTDPSLVPLPAHTVRMPRLKGSYRMWKMAAAKTKVVYQVEADPGGSIPTWVAKRVSRDLPFNTLRSLRKRVSAPH